MVINLIDWFSCNLFKNKLFLSLVLFFIYEPPYFATFKTLHDIYMILDFAIFGMLVVILFLLVVKGFRLDRTFFWICGFFGYIAFVTLIFHADHVFMFVRDNISTISMCLIFFIWLKKCPNTLIDCFIVFDVYILLNLFTILTHPDGLYSTTLYKANWLFGYKNQMIRLILPIISIAIIRSYKNHGRLNLYTIILIAISAVSLIMSQSATSLVGLTLFLLVLFIFHKKDRKLPKAINLFTILAVVVFLYVFIVIARNMSAFSFLIVGVLGRDLTFTSRTVIWDMALKNFSQRPLFGYGYMVASDYVKMFNGIEYYAHPHNYFLYCAMTGGIGLLAILVAGVFFANRSLKKNINSANGMYGKIILFSITALMFMGLVESLTGTILHYPMFVLAMEADKIAGIPYGKSRIRFTLKNNSLNP